MDQTTLHATHDAIMAIDGASDMSSVTSLWAPQSEALAAE